MTIWATAALSLTAGTTASTVFSDGVVMARANVQSLAPAVVLLRELERDGHDADFEALDLARVDDGRVDLRKR